MWTAELSEPWHFSSDDRPPWLCLLLSFMFTACWEKERRYRRGWEMEEAESRMCPSFQDTDHMFPPTAPRWPLFLQGISLCTCVCRGWRWLIGRKAKSFPPLCRHVVGFFPSHNTAVFGPPVLYYFFFFLKADTYKTTHGETFAHSGQSATTKAPRHTQKHTVHIWGIKGVCCAGLGGIANGGRAMSLSQHEEWRLLCGFLWFL